MQKQLVPTLDYPKSDSIVLEQSRLNQATQVVVANRWVSVTLETCEFDRLLIWLIAKVDGKHVYYR